MAYGWEIRWFDLPDQEEEMRTELMDGWEPFAVTTGGLTQCDRVYVKRPNYREIIRKYLEAREQSSVKVTLKEGDPQ